MQPTEGRTQEQKSGQTLPASLSRVNLHAAGIDVGSEFHFVAVPSDRDSQAVRRFGCFTPDLHQLANWLERCGIKTVVMESTGVYWIPLFQILETRGFEVKLVNARHVKNVPGRKTDVVDCQWLQQLHTYGLLSGSFRPNDDVCVLRSYLRQRDTLVRSSSTHIQRMQKALVQMNLQLHRVISDITGVTGMRILRAVLKGERNPEVLANMKDERIRSDRATIAKALQGDYREEHLFVLKQEVELYDGYQEKIAACEKEIARCLDRFDAKVNPIDKPLGPSKSGLKRPDDSKEQLCMSLYRMSGVDFTRIHGLAPITVQTILSEVGLDAKGSGAWKIGLGPSREA